MLVGGDDNLRKCFTSSSPIPRLLPVIKTDFGDSIVFVHQLHATQCCEINTCANEVVSCKIWSGVECRSGVSFISPSRQQ